MCQWVPMGALPLLLIPDPLQVVQVPDNRLPMTVNRCREVVCPAAPATGCRGVSEARCTIGRQTDFYDEIALPRCLVAAETSFTHLRLHIWS